MKSMITLYFQLSTPWPTDATHQVVTQLLLHSPDMLTFTQQKYLQQVVTAFVLLLISE